MSKERFDAIVRKYTGIKIPEHVTELMGHASKPVSEMLSDYAKIKRKADKMNLDETKRLATLVGAAQGLMGWTDAMLGVEFADDILRGRSQADSSPERRRTQAGHENVVMELDMEEWAVLDACVEAAKQMILKKTKLAGVPLNRQESHVVDRIEDLQRVIRGAGEQAFMRLPQTKVYSTGEQISAFNQLLISTYAGVEDAVLAWQIEKWRGE
jgi:hypothetical protein